MTIRGAEVKPEQSVTRVARGRVPPRLKPGWPLVVIFAGMPLWWVLGLVQVIFFAMSIPMLIHILGRRDALAPRGFGIWLLFLVWLLGGLLVMQVDAPGAVSGESATRYLTFGYRFGWYVAGTIALLYAVSSRSFLSTQRISFALSLMFVALLGGGILGVTIPTLEFPSMLELILPRSVSSHSFVSNLIHPQVAQLHTFLGYAEARPSAPFTFTNEWGLSIAATLPFFVVSWWQRGGSHRALVPVLCGLALIPIVSSMNRGLWLALLAMLAYVTLRGALRGHLNTLAFIVVGASLAAMVVFMSPLGDLIAARLDAPHSNESRTNLSSLSVESALQGSPVIGFGTTRDVQGNFTSIAGGATDACPACSPPALGTQGQLWLLIFGAGVVGVLLFVAFFGGQLLRHWGDRSPYSLAGSASVLACMVTMPVYNSVGPAIYICLIAVAVMNRDSDRPRERHLADLLLPVRRNWRLVAGCAVMGALAGGGFQYLAGPSYSVTQSVLVPRDLVVGTTDTRPLSMDSEGELARSGPVLAAIGQASGVDDAQLVSANVEITAEPNSRILNITFSHRDPNVARDGSAQAAEAFLALRNELYSTSSVPPTGQDAAVLRQTLPRSSNDPWVVAIGSGLMLGLTGGLVLAWASDGRTDRLRHRPERRGIQLPTLARVPGEALRDVREDYVLTGVRQAVGTYAPLCAVLPDRRQQSAILLARMLDAETLRVGPWSGSRVLLIASTRSRARPVRRLHRACLRGGLDPVGLILVEE